MAADVHVDLILPQEGVDPLLHVEPLVLTLRRVGVDGVVAHDDCPVGLVVAAKLALEPFDLRVGVLTLDVGIRLGLLMVAVDERGRVDEDDLDLHPAVFEDAGVVPAGHLPAAADPE